MSDSARAHVYLTRLTNSMNFRTSKISSKTANSYSCNTSTFYLRLKEASGQKIQLSEVQTLPNGNFILVGTVTLLNSEQEGFICLLSNSGSLVSARQIRINDKPVSISTIRVMLDGKIVIAGILHDVVDRVFLSLLDTNLITDWVKVFDVPTQPVKVTLDFFAENDQMAFAMQLNTSIVYSLINNDGSVVWYKEVAPAGLTTLIGFSELNFSVLGLVSNCTRAGKQEVEVLQINQTDGSITASDIIGNGIDENNYFKTVSFSDRQIALGIVKKSPTQFQLVRDIMYASANIETEHTYTIPGNIDFNTTGAMDNAGDALGLCIPSQGKLIFIRHFAYYQTWPEYTREYNLPAGASISAIARSFNDGGYLFGLNNNNSNELILIKTDSIGRLAGCSYNDVSNDYTETLNKQNTVSGTTANDIVVGAASATLTTVNSSLSQQFDCNENYCPLPPPDDTCLSSYLKTLRSNSHVDAFTSYYLMKNDNQLVTTDRYDRILGNLNQLTYGIKLFDEKGRFMKGVNVFLDGVSSYFYSRQIDDQHIMLIHYFVQNSIPCYAFTLIDDNLQIVWTKSVQTFNNYNFNTSGTAMGDLIRDKEGNYYFVANSLGFDEPPKVLAYKMDASGNPLWLKIYDVQGGYFLTCNATTTSSSVIIIIEGAQRGSVSVQLDKATGQMLNAFQYQNSTDGTIYNRLVEEDNGRIFYAGNNAQSQFVMGVFDTTGRPIKMRWFDQDASDTRAATVKSGMLYAEYVYYTGTAYRSVLLKADSSLTPQFINEYDMLLWGFPQGMAVSDNGSIYLGGNFTSGGLEGNYFDPYLQKFDPDGGMGTCPSSPSHPSINDIDLNTISISFNEVVNSFTPINVNVAFVPDTNGQHISAMLCSSTPQCNSISISGTQSICQLNQDYVYHAKRNASCTLTPVWLCDTSFATLQKGTDSTSVFKFKRTGSTWIRAKLNAGCTLYWDSILVKIQLAPSSFSLGNDTLLCPGDSVVLNAKNGFNSYQWQDGSTDSVLIAKVAGKYFVQVNNVCGDAYRDTIVISPAIVPSLTIGNDTTSCIADTIYIHASSGFSDYQWRPSAVTGSGKDVFIVPAKNETVSLIAKTADGCLAHDTLRISTLLPKPVSLGADRYICASDSAVLSTGDFFSTYLWSTGQQTSTIDVTKAGEYWVQTIDESGCRSRDTIKVQVYNLPYFNLGNDFDLCKNEHRQLDPGSFNQYAWQDGSSNRYFVVAAVGTYWVKVKDANGCSFSDTVALRNILPLPVDFLKQSDSICQYAQLKIVPLETFSSYSWSTGSSQSSVTVDRPGSYVLKVTDENGCQGTDTIIVSLKTCNYGIWVPTAFTPNNDGKNDVFRPLLFGNVLNYRFIIYDRWGQKVFETTDLSKGWDGKLNGNPESSFVFVWQCFYQFVGGNPSFQKGTVTLVH